MNKDLKIVIIGFGSIGQRHYRNLSALGYKNVYTYDVDQSKTAGHRNRLENLSKKSLKDFSVAFICNPNNKHIKAAIICAQSGCHLFIEKPLSHELRNIDKLIKICKQKKLITMIGCNMRFHPCLQYIKKYLEKNKLGKVYGISLEFGYYLPFWRPKQDYRKNYAALKKTGGGIILDDIHEFDLLFWLNDFEKVEESKFVFNHASDLEIETEDNCFSVFKFKNKILGSVKSDYLQKFYTRTCKITGERGNLEWDFKENAVCLKNEKGGRILYQIKNFNFNEVYINEVKYFFNRINQNRSTFNDIELAKKIFVYCLKRL